MKQLSDIWIVSDIVLLSRKSFQPEKNRTNPCVKFDNAKLTLQTTTFLANKGAQYWLTA